MTTYTVQGGYIPIPLDTDTNTEQRVRTAEIYMNEIYTHVNGHVVTHTEVHNQINNILQVTQGQINTVMERVAMLEQMINNNNNAGKGQGREDGARRSKL